MASIENLPPSSSPSLALLHPTKEEKIAIWHLNGQVWRGRLSLEAYIQRDQFLANQVLTREGGITSWILTDATKLPNARPILASCESIKKRALVQMPDGKLNDAISHGIGSVFCDPQYRGKGYARRMMEELGKKLDTWDQPGSKRTDFTVLYSDIGKTFYAKYGWKAFTSSHISLPPVKSTDAQTTPAPKQLLEEDLANLCRIDEAMLRQTLEQPRQESNKIRVALVPDVETMSWHHAREDFVAKEILGRTPRIKGLYVQCNDGRRVWCIWSRFFGNASTDGNTLYVLRMVVEGEESLTSSFCGCTMKNTGSNTANQEQMEAAVSILRSAQIEAAKWEMNNVQVWNPSPTIVQAAKAIDQSSYVVHRDVDSVASLKWHTGGSSKATIVEWLFNEKYGWC